MNQVNQFPTDMTGEQEIRAFRNIAIQAPFVYPQNGYSPEQFGPLSMADFLAGPGKDLSFKIPGPADIAALIKKIKKECCRK